MKKLHLSMIALAGAATMLTSCSNEVLLATPDNGGNVTFNVAVPGSLSSRAFADGTTAQQNVVYYVYDQANGTSADPVLTGSVPMSSLKGNVTVGLATGHSYDVVFLATATDAPYTYSKTARTLTIDTSALVNSSESLDAFYDVLSFTVLSSKSYDAKLTRPFAQLNIGTKDVADYEAVTGSTVAKTSVTISQVYTTLSLMNDTPSIPEENVTYTVADLPTATDGTFPVTYTPEGSTTAVPYTYLAMDYILVPADVKDMVEVTMTVEDADGNVLETKEYNNIPLQGNYRTNLYGSLLTTQQEFNVEILPGFVEEYNVAMVTWDGKTVTPPTVNEATKTISIASGDQLAGFAQYAAENNLENYTVTLTNNIDLGGYEMPTIGSATRADNAIGAGSTAFKGVFDGGGNVIKNFTITNNSTDKNSVTALIPAVSGQNAVVRNLSLENVTVSSASAEQTAAVVGLLADGATVDNVKVLSGKINGGKGTAGVVARVLQNGFVTNCSNAADVTASGANCGGIVGAAYYNNVDGNKMSIEKCTNSGNITSNVNGVVGGIVGLSVCNVIDCKNTGTVTNNSGGTGVGGIIGEQQNIGNVTGCINSGAVINNNNTVGTGGIIGFVRYSGAASIYTSKAPIIISGCQNSASIDGGNDAGGIVGTMYNYGTVTECTNTAPKISARSFAAGIVGSQQYLANNMVDSFEQMMYITNNTSTTTLENITGSLTRLIVYVNHAETLTLSGNTPSQE